MSYIGNVVYLRAMGSEDWEKMYEWRINYDMQKMTSGPLRFISKDNERNRTQEKAMGSNSDIYLSICAVENDEMIGWISINSIDHRNQKCKCGGIVIGNKKYQDGLAAIEAGKMMLQYVFDELNMNTVRGACLKEHLFSRASMEAKFYVLEGIERDGIFKGGKFHDIMHYSLRRSDWREHVANGEFEDSMVIRRLVKLIKQLRSDKEV